MDLESFEEAFAHQPAKRKRSSILKPPEKRTSTRDSRTVSFNDRCIYKELHRDGTCDITNFFLCEDMDLTMMEIVEPDCQNVTITSSVDMSMEQTNFATQDIELTLMPESQDADTQTNMSSASSSPDKSMTMMSRSSTIRDKSMIISRSTILHEKSMILSRSPATHEQSISMAESPSPEHEKTVVAHETSSISPDVSVFSSTASPSPERTILASMMTQVSDISSLNASNLSIQFANDTLYGAFHDSNNLSMQSSRTSGVDTLLHNCEALNECIQKVEQEIEECRQRLDSEIEDLFKFYRHIVNKSDKYEFAIAIFGLRHSLWLIIKVNPETYPNEKLRLRFAVNKNDRNLYPFADYSEAVRMCTKEGSQGYLTKFVINAQRFRRFLRKIGYRKATN